jgi:hypothetical protein
VQYLNCHWFPIGGHPPQSGCHWLYLQVGSGTGSSLNWLQAHTAIKSQALIDFMAVVGESNSNTSK